MSLSLKGAERCFAQAMAEATDDEQADFFNEFGRLLPLVCKASWKAEQQIAYIVRNLDSSGRAVLKALGEMVALDEQERTRK